MNNLCVCCGAIIPEGRHICLKCEKHGFAVNDSIEQAYRQGYDAGVKAADQITDKHWNECGQIAEYDDENKKLLKLLKNESLHIDLLEIITGNYTYEQQREIFVEECAEAIKAVQKLKRAAEKSVSDYQSATTELISEVADVLIMAQQMRVYLGDAVDKEISYKLERQINRLRGEE